MSTTETELSIGPSAIEAYSRLNYHMWFALAEFVDNSTQSRVNYGNIIDDVLRSEGTLLTVNIIHNRIAKSLTIHDNSIGMTRSDLEAALKIARPTNDSTGRSKYGMGMKTAAFWIGNKWTVRTCEWGSGEEWTAEVDIRAIIDRGAKIPLTMKRVGKDEHYTEVTIHNMQKRIQKRSEETIMTYLGSMYMFDLRPDSTGVPRLKLTYNGEEIVPPSEHEWDTDPSGSPMRKDLPELRIGDKTVRGWVGVLRSGGRKFGGFSLFQHQRQIIGFPAAWKPRSIFGGVDDEGANNRVSQLLTGVLELDGFVLSHTKDAVLFENDEEEQLENFLVEQTKHYAEYIKSGQSVRRGQSNWSRQQIRELAEDLRPEFTSPEIVDAISTARLPPLEVIQAAGSQRLQSLTSDDTVLDIPILDDLEIRLSVTETSPWEPYVSFVPGEGSILHVIVNGLHPYYRTLESKESLRECIHQFLYDAVAEYRTQQKRTALNPDTVRNLKNDLLRARAESIANADETVRRIAEVALDGALTASSEGN